MQKFYDSMGDTLIVEEDENENIVTVTIKEYIDDNGDSTVVSFILDKYDAVRLSEFLLKKFLRVA